MNMNIIVVLSVLAVTAMMLQGCGGGGETPGPAPGSFKLVSQTFRGAMATNMSIPGMPGPPPNTAVEMLFDMDRVRFRQNTQTVVKVSTPTLNMTTTTIADMIFDASTKRATFYTDTQITHNSTPIPPRPATCQDFEFPNMVALDAVKKCVQDFPFSGPPEDAEDGLKKFLMNVPLAKSEGVAGTEVVYTDKDFVIKKIIADVSTVVPGHPPMAIHEEMIDMDSKAGAPDSSAFVVPAEWGTCTKAALPPIPPSDSPALKAFMQCVGMGASQALVTV